MRDPIRTGLSQAYWRIPTSDPNERPNLIPANIPGIELRYPLRNGATEVCWFDHLLEGGIVIPGNAGPALCILLEGAPGTGKTIMATELCYRLATNNKLRSLYLSSEAPASWLISNCKDLGWDKQGTIFNELSSWTDLDKPGVWVCRSVDPQDPSHVLNKLPTDPKATTNQVALIDLIKWAIGLNRGDDEPSKPARMAGQPSGKHLVDILVIDNLNTPATLDYNKVGHLFNESVARILIIVLDSPPDGRRHFWEYLADTIIHLESKYDDKTLYLLRTIQIVKARYQQHVWGVHQLKIYEPRPANYTPQQIMRMHPHREEGGIFIFPSIHYFLSKYKRRPAGGGGGGQLWYVPSAIDELTSFFPAQGYPGGRCTALIGGRGSYKSHLGYLEVLYRIVHRAERALIVSLRDDEDMTRSTIQAVLDAEDRLYDGKNPRKCEVLEQQELLEILYFAPGSITPEEFFHRLLVSVLRLKQNNSHVSLLFNSVDQVGSNFPLCANEPLFVPGIIHMLSAEAVTSIFVAADAPGQPKGLYGLESAAELMLAVERNRFDRERYLDAVRKANHQVPDNIRLDDPHWSVTVTVARFPSGRPVGNKGFLELVSSEDKNTEERNNQLIRIFRKPGLHFVASAPDPVR